MTQCLRCVDLKKRLADAEATILALWDQAKLRDQLRTGNWDEQPTSANIANLLAGELVDREAA